MRTLLAIVLLLAACAGAHAAGPRILVQSESRDTVDPRRADGVASAWENLVAERIDREFPCVSTITAHEVGAIMDHLRQRALLAATDEQQASADKAFLDFAGAYGADYLVVLQVTVDASRCVLRARWLDTRHVKALVDVMDSVAYGPGVVDALDRLGERLVDEAAYFEICAYKGPIKMTVNTTLTPPDKREEYPVFCNGMDQQYVKTTGLSKVADTTLDVTRTRRSWASGSLGYHAVETSSLHEEDPCHPCNPQRKGVRIYTENSRATVDITGLSQESSTAGQILTDVRANLKFDRNGTFRLEIEAASERGDRKIHIERKAEGNCDTAVAKPKEDYTERTDIPVAEIMGPFPGTPRDKVLTGRDTFRSKNPVTGEETTIHVEFSLKRD